jgi:hypothetical protein
VGSGLDSGMHRAAGSRRGGSDRGSDDKQSMPSSDHGEKRRQRQGTAGCAY